MILEVDLEYPKEVHDSHKDYSIAPEHLLGEYSILFDYCKQLKSKFNIPIGGVQKLVPNLMNKTTYVTNY